MKVKLISNLLYNEQVNQLKMSTEAELKQKLADLQNELQRLTEQLDQVEQAPSPKQQDQPVVSPEQGEGHPVDNAEPKGAPEGEVGVFDGEFVLMPNHRRYQVPPNYASKSVLVVGDKLKLVAHGDNNEFKLVEQTDRVEESGILTKLENQWVVKVGDQTFRLISAAVRYHEGEIGDRVQVALPADYQTQTGDAVVRWAAVKTIEKLASVRPRYEPVAQNAASRYAKPRTAEQPTSEQDQFKLDGTIKDVDKPEVIKVPVKAVEVNSAAINPATVTLRKGEINIDPSGQGELLINSSPSSKNEEITLPAVGATENGVAAIDTDEPEVYDLR